MIPDLSTNQLIFLFGSLFFIYLISRSVFVWIQFRKNQFKQTKRLEESQNKTQELFTKMEENRRRFNHEMENLKNSAEMFENQVNEAVKAVKEQENKKKEETVNSKDKETS